MSAPDANVTAADVKALREKTGAGMMDCKRALVETGGDVEKAVEALRVKLGNKVQKLAGRETSEGTVQAYIHATGQVGALVQVDCNTDFVAKNEDFVAFAREVALHVAAAPETRYVTVDDVPEDVKDAELRVYEQQAEAEGKPDQIRTRIAEGKLQKWLAGIVLLEQEHINPDKHDGKTIDQIRKDLSATTGENIVIRRFSRFAVGE